MNSAQSRNFQFKAILCLLTLTLWMTSTPTASGLSVLQLQPTAIFRDSITQSTETRRLRVIFVNDKNQSLDNIQEQDVEVWENGIRQQVKLERQHVSTRYALVVDTSGSLRSQFPQVLETARAFIRANSDADETALIRFVDSSVIQVVQTFTSDKSLLLSKIDKLMVQGGQTALVDAIYASAEYLNQNDPKDRSKNHALVLITDGENRQSNHPLEELSKFIETRNMRVFSIGLTSELDNEDTFTRKAPKQKAEELLMELAKRSGGRTFFIKKTVDFPESIAQVIQDLHSDYLISYTSSTVDKKPRIEIKVAKSPEKKNRKAIFNSLAYN
jgi:VWFA-related protein